MIRKIFTQNCSNKKAHELIKKYHIPTAHLHLNRKTVSNAFLVGLFFSMMPMPMQMLAVILCVPFITFNVPLGLTLVWISNPFTMPFIFYVEYLLGNWVLDQKKITTIELSIEWFEKNLSTIFLPLFTGALIAGVVLGLTGKFLVNYLWRRSVKKEWKEKGVSNYFKDIK